MDKQTELDELAVIALLQKEIKNRKEAIEEAKTAGRDDLIGENEAEIAVLEVFLPEAMSADELREIVAAAIAETGASAPCRYGQGDEGGSAQGGWPRARWRGQRDGARAAHWLIDGFCWPRESPCPRSHRSTHPAHPGRAGLAGRPDRTAIAQPGGTAALSRRRCAAGLAGSRSDRIRQRSADGRSARGSRTRHPADLFSSRPVHRARSDRTPAGCSRLYQPGACRRVCHARAKAGGPGIPERSDPQSRNHRADPRTCPLPAGTPSSKKP